MLDGAVQRTGMTAVGCVLCLAGSFSLLPVLGLAQKAVLCRNLTTSLVKIIALAKKFLPANRNI